MRLRRRLGRRDDPRARWRPRARRVVAEIGDDAQVGFHGHENLALGVANSIYAIRAGATQIDGSTRRFGAGAGNTPCEALVAVCDKLGIRTGIDVLRMFDVAEDVVRPVMDGECALDRLSLIMGYAGVYSSFLKHAYRAAERYGVSGADILLECGERRLVGGQEDEIIDIAVGLAKRRLTLSTRIAHTEEVIPMQMDDMILVSIDDHFIEPPDMFKNHVPARWHDEVPKVVRNDEGIDEWVFQGEKTSTPFGLAATVGWPKDQWGYNPGSLHRAASRLLRRATSG